MSASMMAQAPTEEKKAKAPKVELTLEQVKRAIGKNCSDEVARAVLKSDNPKKKMVEVKQAYISIAMTAGDGATNVFRTLEDERIATLFVEYPSEFTDIAKEAREWADYAFNALGVKNITELFIKDPGKFIEIAKATGKGAGYAFGALENETIKTLFVEHPDILIKSFGDILTATGKGVGNALDALKYEKIAELFVEHPDILIKNFGIIARTVGENAYDAFEALGNETIATLFVEHPDILIKSFREIAKGAKEWAWDAFEALEDEGITNKFIDYYEGRVKLDAFILQLRASDNAAIELGKLLDDLHDNNEERMKYLDKLTTIQVFGLLLSNPAYFYTSSNHLLFDRLKKDLGDKTISDLFEEYDLVGTEECRNFLFRAMNYDRFYGKDNSMLNDADVDKMLGTILSPLDSDKFDKKYYFLLANSLDKIRDMPEVNKPLSEKLEGRLKELEAKVQLTKHERQIASALEYLVYKMDENTILVSGEQKKSIDELGNAAYFNPKDYMVNGKLRIIQVFAKADTEKDHWLWSQELFRKYDKNPTKSEDGRKITYETKDATIVLFMGDDEENKKFITGQLNENPNMIITFGGHSFSLTDNFPYDIFGNKKGNVLFIPGSCGSTGSVPDYMAANPNTNLKFFSYTSRGVGTITNAIVDALLNTIETKRFSDILEEDSERIKGYGGDISTIKTSTDGEALLKYIYSH